MHFLIRKRRIHSSNGQFALLKKLFIKLPAPVRLQHGEPLKITKEATQNLARLHHIEALKLTKVATVQL